MAMALVMRGGRPFEIVQREAAVGRPVDPGFVGAHKGLLMSSYRFVKRDKGMDFALVRS